MLKATPDEAKTTLPCERYPDLWFQELGRHKRTARQGCKTCPLQEACREWAIERHLAGHPEHGIWGGLDLHDREVEARRRSDTEVVYAA